MKVDPVEAIVARWFEGNDRETESELIDCHPDHAAELSRRLAALARARRAMRLFGRFEIGRTLGAGGMGQVYEAIDRKSGERVAVKVFHANRGLERTLQRLRSLQALRHPCIVAPDELDHERDVYFARMELVVGRSLQELVDTGAVEALPFSKTAALFADVADALAAAHEAGVVHRDVKPGNLILDHAGYVRVTDFDVAHIQGQNLTMDGEMIGTPNYMSPEQALGEEVDGRSDVYSLGATLYEALTLRCPFEGRTNAAVYARILRGSFRRPRLVRPQIPRALDRVVRQAMARDADARYQSASAFADDLRRFTEGRPVVARPRGLLRRHPRVTAAICGVIALALTLAALAWRAERRGRQERVAELEALERSLLARRESVVSEMPAESDLLRIRRRIAEAWAQRNDRIQLSQVQRRRDRAEAMLTRIKGELQECRLRLQRCRSGEPEWTSADSRAYVQRYVTSLERARVDRAPERVAAFRDLLSRHLREDSATWRRLFGPASLSVRIEPATAMLHLFRYEEAGDHCISRLVPVPVGGSDGVLPGTRCLVVLDVETGSLAGEAGLAAGDLVLDLNGSPCGDGLFVTSVETGGLCAEAGVTLLEKLGLLDGRRVEGWFEWRIDERKERSRRKATIADRTVFYPAGTSFREVAGLEVDTPCAILARPAPAELRLVCLRAGRRVELRVPAGARSGLRCERTANPLVFDDRSRVAREVGGLEPGSYLLVARAPGRADQRFPFVAPPDGRVEIKGRLRRKEDMPPGFAWIPGGRFRFGGDPEARGCRDSCEAGDLRLEPAVVDLDGFFIGRDLVSMREWAAFMNAPETRRKRQAGDDPLFGLPRFRELNRPDEELLGFEDWDPGAPVCGVPLSEVRAFIAFLNASDPHFRYALPSEEQWEKAARGADGRWFTWGNRFDGGLTMGAERESGEDLLGFAARYEPADESPYGVRDMNGTRREWTSTADRDAPGHYMMRGHAYLDGEGAPVYRLCDRNSQPGFDAHMYFGFRLVAYPRRRE